MRSVGVRELRQTASAVLRRVEGGETVAVTDRGRPVALLIPLPSATGLEALRASGDVATAAADLSDLAAPLQVGARKAPSDVLAALRRHER